MLKKSIKHIVNKISSNKKVAENYFFMTAIQVINSAFGILIYPYVIRVLGAGSYGLYVFALSVTTYFIGFISFGFNFPALKAIIANKDNIEEKNKIISSVFTAKSYLGLASAAVFSILLFTVPVMSGNKFIFTICFTQILSEMLFPTWYFQGMQQMKLVTYIQLSFRIISLPFIFFLIKSPSDIWIYAIISSATVVSGGISAVILLRLKENIKYRFESFQSLTNYFKDGLPFFWSSVTGIIKQESVTIIIGSFFSMRDVAFYDLANKIITIPRLLTTSINGALFPKVMENVQKSIIKKIIKYEILIGISVIAGVIIFGYWIILLLGGNQMTNSYPLAIILSITILVWLLVGCYISFIFVPENKYYFVTQNQLVALAIFITFCIPGVLLFHNILAVVSSLTISGLAEIIYCNYLIKKYKLL